jgi:hypothetical protein
MTHLGPQQTINQRFGSYKHEQMCLNEINEGLFKLFNPLNFHQKFKTSFFAASRFILSSASKVLKSKIYQT